MPTEIVLSHSDIAGYLKCPRQWMWRYFFGFRTLPSLWDVASAAETGTRVHSALEVWYKHGSDPKAEYERISKEVLKYLEDNAAPHDLLNRFYKEIVKGRTLVASHELWRAENPYLEEADVVLVEGSFVAPVEVDHPDISVSIIGKIDLLRQNEVGEFLIDDWKTSGLPVEDTHRQYARSYQPQVYRRLVREWLKDNTETPDAPIRTFFTLLFKNRHNIVAASNVHRFEVGAMTEEAAQQKEAEFIGLITEVALTVKATEEALSAGQVPATCRANPGDACRWCAYNSACDMMETYGPSRAFEILDATMERGSVYDRYKKKS